jgi:hypothetical protein
LTYQIPPTQFKPQQPAAPIVGELTGDDVASACGITVYSSSPVLGLCRSLIAASLSPDQSMVVFRRGVVALRVRSLQAGAALTVAEPDRGRPHFAKWKPWPSSAVASSVRQSRRDR